MLNSVENPPTKLRTGLRQSTLVIPKFQNLTKSTTFNKTNTTIDNTHSPILKNMQKNNIQSDNNPKIDIITRNCYISPNKNRILFNGCSPDIIQTINTMNKDKTTKKPMKKSQSIEEMEGQALSLDLSNKNSMKTQQITKKRIPNMNHQYQNCQISQGKKSREKLSRGLKSPRVFNRSRPASNHINLPSDTKQVDLKKLCQSLQTENKQLKVKLQKYEQNDKKNQPSQIQQLNLTNAKLTVELQKISKHQDMLEHLIHKLRYELQMEIEARQKCELQNQKLKESLKRLRHHCFTKGEDRGKMRQSFPNKLNFKDMNHYYHHNQQQIDADQKQRLKRKLSQIHQPSKQNILSSINIITENRDRLKINTPKRIICSSPSTGSLFELSPQ